MQLQEETNASLKLVVQILPAIEQRLREIEHLQAQDSVCQRVCEFCQIDWPQDKKSINPDILPYFKRATELLIC